MLNLTLKTPKIDQLVVGQKKSEWSFATPFKVYFGMQFLETGVSAASGGSHSSFRQGVDPKKISTKICQLGASQSGYGTMVT